MKLTLQVGDGVLSAVPRALDQTATQLPSSRPIADTIGTDAPPPAPGGAPLGRGGATPPRGEEGGGGAPPKKPGNQKRPPRGRQRRERRKKRDGEPDEVTADEVGGERAGQDRGEIAVELRA